VVWYKRILYQAPVLGFETLRSRRKDSAPNKLAGALRTDGGGCMLCASRVVKMEIPLQIRSERSPHTLNLRNLILADRDAVRFLERGKADCIKLKKCPAIIREWIVSERNAE